MGKTQASAQRRTTARQVEQRVVMRVEIDKSVHQQLSTMAKLDDRTMAAYIRKVLADHVKAGAP